MRGSPGARTPTTRHFAHATSTTKPPYVNSSTRQLVNRIVGLLHGYPKTKTTYDETTAWAPLQPTA